MEMIRPISAGGSAAAAMAFQFIDFLAGQRTWRSAAGPTGSHGVSITEASAMPFGRRRWPFSSSALLGGSDAHVVCRIIQELDFCLLGRDFLEECLELDIDWQFGTEE